jgi:hypothetical protein
VRDVEEVLAYVWLWVIHAPLAGVLTVPIAILGWRRTRWSLWDLAAFILPYGLWAALMAVPATGPFPTAWPGWPGKSLANLVECLVISLAIPVAALARVIIGARGRDGAIPAGLIGLCGVAAFTFFLTPALPE